MRAPPHGATTIRMRSMRTLLFAAAGAAAFATPAFASQNGGYVGIEGGATMPQSSDLDVLLNNATPFNNGFKIKYKTGYDVDLIGGYKLGLLRLEVEGAYKRSSLKSLRVSDPLLAAVGTAAGVPVTADKFNLDGHVAISSLMANALVDSNFGPRGLAATSAAVSARRGRTSAGPTATVQSQSR